MEKITDKVQWRKSLTVSIMPIQLFLNCSPNMKEKKISINNHSAKSICRNCVMSNLTSQFIHVVQHSDCSGNQLSNSLSYTKYQSGSIYFVISYSLDKQPNKLVRFSQIQRSLAKGNVWLDNNM